MRYFHIPDGQYKGEYIIYESREEFVNSNQGKKFYIWNEFNPEEIQVGEYVEALDGFLVPLLRKTKYKNNYFFRFPQGTFVAYETKKGIKFSKFYAFTTQIDQSSVSGKSRLTRLLNEDHIKGQFALLIASGMDPVQAFKLVLAPKLKMTISKKKFINMLLRLLSDEVVMEQIKEYQNNEFLKKMSEDPDFSDENILNYIKEFMKHVRKGSQTHLNSILPILKLTGKLPEDYAINPKNSKKKEIIDTDFTEIPPEQIPPTTTSE